MVVESLEDLKEITKVEEQFTPVLNGIEKMVNNMCFSGKVESLFIVEWYLRMHRTLQQSFIRFVALTIKQLADYYAKNPDRFDARNESAKNWIIKVSKIDDEYFPFI